MFNVTEFTPYIATNVLNCPSFIIERAVASAVYEFCSKSWCLNEETDPVDIVAGEAEIEFDGDLDIVGLFNVRYNGEIIDKYSESELDRVCPGWKSLTGTEPTKYVHTDTNKVRLVPIPSQDADDAITARIAMAPSPRATKFPDVFGTLYFDAIVAGATSRLMLQQGRPWYNPSLAGPLQGDFRDKMYSARNVVMRDIVSRKPEIIL